MSTQELLQLFPFSKPHQWRTAYLRNKKNLNTQLRLSKRLAISKLRKWYRTQYFVSKAYQDIKVGIRRNEDGVLGATFVSVVLCFAVASLSADALLSFFQAAMTLVESYDFSIIIASGLSVAIFSLCIAWLTAFLLNSISLALTQGLHRTVHKSIRSTLSYGLYFSPRIVAAWLSYLLVMFVPLVMVALIIGTLLLREVISFDQLLLAFPYVIIVASTWIIIIFMQYSLMPLITLYEPEKSFKQAFGRAHSLVIGRGRVFTLMLGCLALAGFFVVSEVAQILNILLKIPYSLTIILGSSLIVIIWTAIITVLFRKRKLARRAY